MLNQYANTVAGIRVQSLHVTREQHFEARDLADKMALAGRREHPSYGILEMTTDVLLDTDPTAWTYL
jgi:hypothetical protein